MTVYHKRPLNKSLRENGAIWNVEIRKIGIEKAGGIMYNGGV